MTATGPVNEYRQDRTSGAWVIIAPGRGKRPRESGGGAITAEPLPPYDPTCPFCPGNERMLAGVIEESPSDTAPGWRTRVVPNKYPALSPPVADQKADEPAGASLPGHGYHEVIVETPRHDADIATLDEAGLTAVLRTYRQRYAALAARPGIKSVVLFKNHGSHAGASLVHPHSQVIASALAAPKTVAATAWARAHYEQEGRCVTCAEIALELRDGRRVVEATDGFLILVPFAAASPFEQRILPRRHQAPFARIDDATLTELGRVLQRALLRLRGNLGNPPYNYVVESGLVAESEAPYGHWSLRIVPDLVTPGGFELGTGLPINPSLPEEDAATLRAAPIAANETSR